MLTVHELELLELLESLEPGFLQLGQLVQRVIIVAEDLLVPRDGVLIFLLEVELYVAHADAVAAHLVSVCGANAFAGGAYFAGAFRALVGGVEQTVGREDEVSLAGYVEAARQVVTRSLKLLNLSLEEGGVEHNAVAYDVHLVALEDAGRH